MSAEAVAWYLDNSEHSGYKLLALVSLAEWADKGGSCHPGMVDIAKRLRVSKRRAEANIVELERAGELLVFPGAGPRVNGGHLTLYYLLRYMNANGYVVPAEHVQLARERRRAERSKALAWRSALQGTVAGDSTL